MDIEAYEEWVKQNMDSVYRVCYYLTRDQKMSSDAMCQVFIDCYKEMRKQKNPEYKSETELAYMAIRLVRKMIKNKKNEQGESI